MRQLLDLYDRLGAEGADRNALIDAFARSQRFPMLEGGSATFLFFDGQPVDAVSMVHWIFGLQGRQPFQRIEGTNAFVLTMDLPVGARVEYKLEIERWGERHLMQDPRNPDRAFDPFGSNSVIRMSGYEDPPWVVPAPGCRTGRIERFSFRSEAWGEDRETAVYLPAEYKPHKHYPLLICFDGDDYLRFTGMRAVLDNLIHRHEVHPMVVAFTNGHRRNAEYAANPTQARFVVHDLLPQLERRFGLTRDPAERGLIGASFGGVITLYTAWSHPGIFGRLMVQSGSFVFTDVGWHDRGELWDPVVAFMNDFRTAPQRLGARLYMSCGVFESLIYYNRSLVPVMRKQGLEVRFEEALDGHNWIAWRDRLREGLTWLFPGRLWMIYD